MDCVRMMGDSAKGGAHDSTVGLLLVPFSPGEFFTTVRQALLAMGYCVRVVDAERWLESNTISAADTVVAVIGCGRSHYRQADRQLARLPEVSVFGIFQRRVEEGNQQLLQRCHDFSVWPCADAELKQRLERLIECAPRKLRNQAVAEQLVSLNMIGQSADFLACCERINKFAGCTAPVLIEGETGTGKDLAARAVHYQSERSAYPFVPVNCGALPDSLFENELFGHEQGAYTGAGKRHAGLVRQTEGGTLFLDEIDALSMKGQVALLRFLEEQKFRPLGSSATQEADVRVIAASNSELQRLVAEGKFRSDLFFRLNILSIRLPPLRVRTGDVDLLAADFLQRYRNRYNAPARYLHPETLDWMRGYAWPGNVRELKNLIHREFLLAEDSLLRIDQPGNAAHSPALVDESIDLAAGFNDAKANCINAFERRYLSRLMLETSGNVTLAAKRAGKERRALGKLLKKHGIQRSDYHK